MFVSVRVCVCECVYVFQVNVHERQVCETIGWLVVDCFVVAFGGDINTLKQKVSGFNGCNCKMNIC